MSDPFFMFCAPEVILSGSEGVGSRFHVLRPRNHFRRYRGRRVSFSYFARPNSFSTVPRSSGPVFMFCAIVLIFGVTEGVGLRFHVLCSRTCFRRYRGRRDPFSCFAHPVSFLAVLGVSGPFFIFCAPELIFGGTEGVCSRFHVLRSQNHFRRYRVPFSCFARPDYFSTVPGASGPDFMFCAPGFFFGGTKGVPSRFYVFRSQTCFRRY
jgi:hypothetical protein